MIGQTLQTAKAGVLTIGNQLAWGAQGEVYLTNDPSYLLKVCNPEDAVTKNDIAKFKRKMVSRYQTFCRLNFGADIEVTCLPLEYHELEYDGPTPAYLMRRASGREMQKDWKVLSSLSFRDRVRIARGLANGLSYLHARQVVHADFKPDNFFFNESGMVQILDIDGGGYFGNLPSTVLFSPDVFPIEQYKAPELVKSGWEPVWRNSQLRKQPDLWALAVLLYQIIVDAEGPFPVKMTAADPNYEWFRPGDYARDHPAWPRRWQKDKMTSARLNSDLVHLFEAVFSSPNRMRIDDPKRPDAIRWKASLDDFLIKTTYPAPPIRPPANPPVPPIRPSANKPIPPSPPPSYQPVPPSPPLAYRPTPNQARQQPITQIPVVISQSTPIRPKQQPRNSIPIQGSKQTDYGLMAMTSLVLVLGIGFLLFVGSVVSRQSFSSSAQPPNPAPLAILPSPFIPTITRQPALPSHVVLVTDTPLALQSFGLVNADILRVRDGPGQGYDILSKVQKGDRLTILGRDQGCNWFQVQTTDGVRGWASVDFIDSSVSHCDPTEIEAPPTKTLLPTKAPLPKAIDTATPLPPDGVIINYYAEQEFIRPGSCTVLHWGIEHVQAIYLNNEGVLGWDQRNICPNTTSVYTLRIVMNDGSAIERAIVIRVQ